MVVGDVVTGTEVVVIGGGPGGYSAALRAAQLGKEVTLIEANALGGVCLHDGCIPSKALIGLAATFHRLPNLSEQGIEVGQARVDWVQMQKWKKSTIAGLAQGVQQLCQSNKVQLIRGEGRFAGRHQLAVHTKTGVQRLRFQQAIVASGSRPRPLAAFPFDGQRIVDSSTALTLPALPKQLLVVGGGYIGLELGTMFAKLGSQVTIVEMTGQLLPGIDAQLATVATTSLRRLGVKVLLNSTVQDCLPTDDGLQVEVVQRHPSGEESREQLLCDVLLVGTGRLPNSHRLNLDQAGVAVDADGFIPVDEQCRTNVPHIFAVGDVTGQPLLAHKATHQGLVAAEATAGLPTAFEPATIPAVIFSAPELAYVGLSEEEARQQGHEVTTARFPLQALGRAIAMNTPQGFVKVVADAPSQVLLGVQMAGADVSTLISEAALAVEMGARLQDLALTVHPHPTLGEALMEAAMAALGQPLHFLP